MDAITLLKADHHTVEDLLKQIKDLDQSAHVQRRELFRQIDKERTVHSKIEETIFYPALKQETKAEEAGDTTPGSQNAAEARIAGNRALGGFRKVNRNSHNVALRHPSFRSYADYMESDAFANVLCSETVWWRCHCRLISDAVLLLHGLPVQRLMHDGKLRPHIPTAGVRATAEGKLRYDVLFETGEFA